MAQLQELDVNEIDEVDGGIGLVGAVVGGGLQLARELTDNRPGVSALRVAGGAAIGALGAGLVGNAVGAFSQATRLTFVGVAHIRNNGN